MKLLLDTHILLWWLAGSRQLGQRASTIIASPGTELFVSAASWWEIGIKRSLGRIDIHWTAVRTVLAKNQIKIVAVTCEHAEAAAELPMYHRDPFDRMLVAQAGVERMKLLTRDKQLRDYGANILCV